MLENPLEEQLTSLGGSGRNRLCLISSRGILVAAVAGAVQDLGLLNVGTALGSLGALAIICLFRSPKISHMGFRMG